MTELSLVMPMAGRGSRFAKKGISVPKPLIDLGGRPFFWWAIESVACALPLKQIVAVVLEEHVAQFGIDAVIRSYYPEARIIALPEVTRGAAETAARGVRGLDSRGPLVINDCDHAFQLAGATQIADRLSWDAAGYLVGFRSTRPSYSYVRLAEPAAMSELRVAGTVEKRAVSPYAIAGCYFFSSPHRFEAAYEAFVDGDCPYDELFLSGLYNVMCAQGDTVLFKELAAHIAFGTPEELDEVHPTRLAALAMRVSR